MPRKRDDSDRITAAKLTAAEWRIGTHESRMRCDGFDILLQSHAPIVWIAGRKPDEGLVKLRTVTGWRDLVSLVSVLKGKAE